MENIIDFEPAEAVTSADRLKTFGFIILGNVLFDTIFYLRLHDKSNTYIGALIFLLFTLIFVMFVKLPLRITIFKDSATLQYDYVKLWGAEKSLTIDIPSATYSYKWVSGRSGGSLRLQMYNNYFDQLSLTPSTRNSAFTEDQLNAIDQAITAIKGT